MGPDNTAAIALTAWHLMMPPAANTPLSHKWIRVASYESIDLCERTRTALDRRARDMRAPLMLLPESATRDRFHRWQNTHALCVQNSDPRLSDDVSVAK
jgi:hypothetical protein